MIYVLILFMSTTNDYRSGAAGIVQEFNNETACLDAGKALTRRANTLTWGCYPKGAKQ